MTRRYLTPGPTELHPAVPGLIERALAEGIGSISHRSKEYEAISRRATDGIRRLMNVPDAHHVFFLASGTEGMERALQNLVEMRSHHLVNGAFSDRFFRTASELGKQPTESRVAPGQGFDTATITIPDDAELVCATQNETSTGVSLSPEAIAELKRRAPNALVAVDAVSSAPYPALDLTKIDFTFFSVQKCFGLPAGLGVAIVSPAALEKARALEARGISTGSYHNLASLESFAKKHQTPETPNVLAIYLLGGVCDALLSIGIDAVRAGMKERAERLYRFLDEEARLRAFVTEKAIRSDTVISITTGKRAAELEACLASEGIVVGSGYGEFKNDHLRVANFPMHTAADIEKVIQVLSASR